MRKRYLLGFLFTPGLWMSRQGMLEERGMCGSSPPYGELRYPYSSDKGCTMTRQEMLAAIDGEIARLQKVRDLLRHSNSDRLTAGVALKSQSGVKKPRVLSPDARRRIALGQQRRWAKQRKENALAGAE